jgi:hypothetical protein
MRAKTSKLGPRHTLLSREMEESKTKFQQVGIQNAFQGKQSAVFGICYRLRGLFSEMLFALAPV